MMSKKPYSVIDPAVLRRLEQIKAKGGLPSPKGPAMAIIRLAQRESTSLPVLAHAIKADPTFSVRLVKVAGGVSDSGHRPVVSVRDAVTVLGMPAVRSLALGFSLLSNYRNGKCRNFDYSRFWSHSLARAVALQVLTGATQGSQPEDAFSVGLLARIGELALATLFPQEYSDILQRRVDEPELGLFDLEQEAFVLTHGVLTASMMLDCGLARIYAEPIYFFEVIDQQPLPEGSSQLIVQSLLALADCIGDVCLAPQADCRALMPKLFRLGSRLSLDGGPLVALCERVAHEWRDWGALLGIETGPIPLFEPWSDLPDARDSDGPGAMASLGLTEPMRILVVGDQKSIRNPLCSVLRAAGHEVFEAADGRQGLAMAIELQPQIMLVDLLVEGMDGIELTRTLRQFKVGRSIYVLILTSRDDDEKLVQAFEAGVDDFLSMPVKPRVLAARLRAGQRVVRLQEELARDQEEIRRISAELSVTNQQLEEVGMTDMLTGCPNRRSAMDRIQQEWATATRSQRPLACMVINIDNFKQVNDIHGHEAGDTVLKLVAGSFKDEMRAQDVLARTGGDEFLVICPDTTLEAAVACAERMRAGVETLPIVCGEKNARGSVSVGVAVRDTTTADTDALIRLADQAAYLAKRRRNCVATVQSGSQAALRTTLN